MGAHVRKLDQGEIYLATLNTTTSYLHAYFLCIPLPANTAYTKYILYLYSTVFFVDPKLLYSTRHTDTVVCAAYGKALRLDNGGIGEVSRTFSLLAHLLL